MYRAVRMLRAPDAFIIITFYYFLSTEGEVKYYLPGEIGMRVNDYALRPLRVSVMVAFVGLWQTLQLFLSSKADNWSYLEV